MIPRIGKRGHSFKGAGQYFLHDKKADTKERVEWTYTHNLPTQDPELAMKWMAYTAINRNKLKQEVGVPLTGRKGINQPVYTFSLAWQPEQKPEPNHMRNLALDALELLGLKNHEAVFVAHNETAHPHVHAIVNLVNPENGKTLRPQNDRLKFSTWAEAYEKEHGKIYCEQRVVNNEQRKNGEKVKYRSGKVEQASIIQNLYRQAKDAQSFQQALENKGYTLATGDRRGFVLVDEQGKISSLSRQLKGQRAKDIKERLSGLQSLPEAKMLSENRQHFYRDQYETDRQKKIVDAAIEEEKKQKNLQKTDQKKTEIKAKLTDPSFAVKMDEIRRRSEAEHRVELRKEKVIRDYYKREQQQERIDFLQKQIDHTKAQNEKSKLEEQLEKEKLTLADIDKRMIEQNLDPVDPSVKDFKKMDEIKKKNPNLSNTENTDKGQYEAKLDKGMIDDFSDLDIDSHSMDKDEGLDFDHDR